MIKHSLARPLLVALFVAGLAAGPAAARETVVRAEVKTHRNGEAVQACELIYVVDLRPAADAMSWDGVGLSLIQFTTDGGERGAAIKIGVVNDDGWIAPTAAAFLVDGRDNSGDFSRSIETDGEDYGFFAFDFGPTTAEALERFAAAGEIRIGYRAEDRNGELSVDISDRSDVRGELAACTAALLPETA